MKLNELEDFIAVVDTGSIRAAAKARGVTSPAMTQSIARLEESLHVPLIVRTTRGAVLSDYGRAFLLRAQTIVNEVARSTEELAQMRGAGGGQVTIGTSMTPTSTVIPRAIAEFRRLQPDVRVNIVAGMFHEHLPRLRSGAMSFALGPLPAAGIGGEFEVERLFDNDLVLTVRNGNPHADATSLAELATAEWILGGPDSHGPGAAVLDMFANAGYPRPKVMVQSSSVSVMQALMLESDAICALPRPVVSADPLRRHVTTIKVVEKMPIYPVSFFQRASSPLSPAANCLATLVRRHAHYWSTTRV
jgi:LysR family transcriptional regulator of abg operon